MTDLKNFAPVQINTLYGLDNVKDFYWLFGYDVINVQKGHVDYAQTPGRKIQNVKLVPNSDGRSTD